MEQTIKVREPGSRKRPRGGRDTKVRLALDICKHSQRVGDGEKQRRALKTVCMLYSIDPTTLTRQGLSGEQTPPPVTVNEEPSSSSTVIEATPPPNLVTEEAPSDEPEVKTKKKPRIKEVRVCIPRLNLVRREVPRLRLPENSEAYEQVTSSLWEMIEDIRACLDSSP